MKQIIICILLVFTATNLLSQRMNSSIDILAGFSSTYRVIDGNGSQTEMVRNDLELSKGNFHIGFNFNKRVSDKLYFKTGARYVSMGYKTKEQLLMFGDMSTTSIYFTYDYVFIEVPVNVRYELVEQKKMVPFVEFGVAPMYYFWNKEVLYQDGEDRTSSRNPVTTDFNKLHLALNAGVGINYFMSGGGTSLFAQAHVRYDLTNLVTADDFREVLYGYGIEFGVRRALSYDN